MMNGLGASGGFCGVLCGVGVVPTPTHCGGGQMSQDPETWQRRLRDSGGSIRKPPEQTKLQRAPGGIESDSVQDEGYTDMFAGKIKVGQEGCRVGRVSGVVEVVANSVVVVVVVVVAGDADFLMSVQVASGPNHVPSV